MSNTMSLPHPDDMPGGKRHPVSGQRSRGREGRAKGQLQRDPPGAGASIVPRIVRAYALEDDAGTRPNVVFVFSVPTKLSDLMARADIQFSKGPDALDMESDIDILDEGNTLTLLSNNDNMADQTYYFNNRKFGIFSIIIMC